jgi:hypothetical protein
MIIGEGEIYDTGLDDMGALYRSLRAEYGRCTGHVYIDTAEEEARKVGWVFEKRERYQDTGDTYLQTTWVHVFTAMPTVTRVFHHAKVGR